MHTAMSHLHISPGFFQIYPTEFYIFNSSRTSYLHLSHLPPPYPGPLPSISATLLDLTFLASSFRIQNQSSCVIRWPSVPSHQSWKSTTLPQRPWSQTAGVLYLWCHSSSCLQSTSQLPHIIMYGVIYIFVTMFPVADTVVRTAGAAETQGFTPQGAAPACGSPAAVSPLRGAKPPGRAPLTLSRWSWWTLPRGPRVNLWSQTRAL